LFGSGMARSALRKGQSSFNVLEAEKHVVNYIPVRSSGTIHGLVCTLKRVDEVQDAEFSVRRKLHDRGFAAKYSLDDIAGRSRSLLQCKERAILFSSALDPILITGESGTGKELFAHAIHSAGNRKNGPFVAINCATLPNDLLESELFGYEKGAFTGAQATGKKGLIELAHKGTLFLDEITTLNYPLQAKLLRLISEHEILKLGSDRIIPIDARILAATNEDIENCVSERRFRQDLYYRLNVFRLHIPPLDERPEDIVPLFLKFVAKIDPAILKKINSRQIEIHKALAGWDFKGNARELENIARRFCLLHRSKSAKKSIREIMQGCLGIEKSPRSPGDIFPDLQAAKQNVERQVIQDLMRKYRHKSDVAKALGVSPSTLWRKLNKHGL
jgi:propionate catabolism operon transcriptional regulator